MLGRARGGSEGQALETFLWALSAWRARESVREAGSTYITVLAEAGDAMGNVVVVLPYALPGRIRGHIHVLLSGEHDMGARERGR